MRYFGSSLSRHILVLREPPDRIDILHLVRILQITSVSILSRLCLFDKMKVDISELHYIASVLRKSTDSSAFPNSSLIILSNYLII